MRRLNVRCCCQPVKILGTLPWDEEGPRRREWIIDGKIFGLDVKEMNHRVHIEPELMQQISTMPIDKVIDIISYTRRAELAFKAEGAPLEMLRRLPDFIEGDRA